MTLYSTTWNLPAQPFTITVEALGPTQAAEHMFDVCNEFLPDTADGQRWAGLRHRSMSVGDRIEINGETWVCLTAGWTKEADLDEETAEFLPLRERIAGQGSGR